MNLLELANIINSKDASVAFLQQRGVYITQEIAEHVGNPMIRGTDGGVRCVAVARKLDCEKTLG